MPWTALRPALVLAGLLALAGISGGADDPTEEALREGFESSKTSWRREETDATVTIQAHERSSRAAHDGRASERFEFKAGPGSVLFYSQPLPKIPIGPKLKASLYVRSNRPGVQVFARVVLPEDLDPDTGRPSFLLVPGDTVSVADRWQRLELTDLPTNLERQARVLRVGSNRKVSVEGAYLDRLVVNLYGGAGETEVFLDEMNIGPLPKEKPRAEDVAAEEEKPPLPAPAAPPAPRAEVRDSSPIRLSGNILYKDGIDWVPSIIYAPGADPTVLRQYGFDAMAFDHDSPERSLEEAARAGMWLVPSLATGPEVQPAAVVAAAARHPQKDRVAFWSLGDGLGLPRTLSDREAELERIRQIILGLRELPDGRSRLTTGIVKDGLPQYALAGRNLDLLGIDATDWATVREPLDTYQFLKQRRDLTAMKNPHAPFLAWVSASAPPNAMRNTWGFDDPPSWGRPQVQPEQIRQQVYTALSAGYRAIGFRADAEITAAAGQARLIEMAFLNAEIDLVESLIAKGADPIQQWNVFERDPEVPLVFNPLGTNSSQFNQKNNPMTKPPKEVAPHPTIKAASIPTEDKRGRLMFVVDYASGSQYQPPQMAVNELSLLVPVPENCIGLEISPGGIQVLKTERTTGGRKFILPLFNTTALVLITTDLGMKARLEAEVAKIAPLATELAIRQAQLQLREAAEINGILARDGHPARDAEDLIALGNEVLKSAIQARERMDYALSWAESQRVGRAIRTMKRAHYNKAYEEMRSLTLQLARLEEAKPPYPLTYPIASPPLTAFQTLPQHFVWMKFLRENYMTFGENLLPSGSFDFENAAEARDAGWVNVSHENEDVDTDIQFHEETGYGGDNAALRLFVTPKNLDPKSVAGLVPFLDHPAVAIRSPPIEINKGRLIRIRFLIRLTRSLPAGTGGLMVSDSLGGDQYQFRLTGPCPFWQEVTLYRFAPEDGEMTITLGLAGYGEAYIDRLRVDTPTSTEPGAAPPRRPADSAPIARRLPPPRVNPAPSAGAATRPRR